MIREETMLVLGRGEVYFEPFIDGTRVGNGERYIGNTTTFQIARAIERLERFTSYKGQKAEREGAVISEAHTAQFITDNIAVENVGLWYGEETSVGTFPAGYAVSEEILVRQNRYYQLGKSVQPFGTRHVDTVIVKLDGEIINPTNNYEVDKPLGRLEIIAGAPDIPNESTIDVEFVWRTVTTETVTSHTRDLFGSLRFLATNPVGIRRNCFFPFVRLSARGQVDLKGDEFQQMPFEAEAMRLTPTAEQVYFDTVMAVGLTSDEEAIIDEGGIPLSEFPYWEDQLDIIVNIDIPGADLGGFVYP